MINMGKYLDECLILTLDVQDREDAMKEMVNSLYHAGKIQSRETFLRALNEREAIVSTGIGMGVAIPHAKLPQFEDFFIAIARLERGIEWHSLDKAPVRIIFMIGGPDDKQNEYLRILSSLTEVIKDEEKRKKILSLSSAEEILQMLRE